MSPSESDLRAALRDGEGDSPDVDRIVAGGESVRARRRVQLLTASVAVVLVAAGGITTAALVGNGNGPGRSISEGGDTPASTPTGDATGKPNTAARASARTTPRADVAPPGAPAPATGSGESGVVCPSVFPKQLLPGGGGSGQFGSAGALFSAPVRSIVVCSYGPVLNVAAGVGPARAVLTGSAATQLRVSLETAAKTPPFAVSCTEAQTRAYAFIGVGNYGAAQRAVTATVSARPCAVRVTNGTAVRYEWQPPKDLLTALLAIEPGPRTLPMPHLPSSGVNHGSPVR